MKNLLLLSILFIAFAACSSDDENNNVLDSDAMISLRPAAGTKASTNPEHLSGLEIVKQATGVKLWNKDMNPDNAIGRGFADAQRDTVNVRLLMWGTDIIDQDGKYVPDFIEGEDLVLVMHHDNNIDMDTIGYIKNTTLRTAETQIKEAFEKKDYAKCYEIFDEAFTFLPITGTEWRELKAKNEN